VAGAEAEDGWESEAEGVPLTARLRVETGKEDKGTHGCMSIVSKDDDG